MTVTNARWFMTMGRVEMTDSIKSRRRWSCRFRGGVPRGPFKAALIARENAPACTPGARFRYSSLGIPVAPSSNSGWTFAAAVKINPCGDSAAANERLCRGHLADPGKAHAEVHRVPLSAPLLPSASSPFHRIIAAHSIRAPDRFPPTVPFDASIFDHGRRIVGKINLFADPETSRHVKTRR